MSSLLAFPVRTPEQPGLEIRVNFGMFAGREATAAEIEELGAALLPEIGHAQISSEKRLRDRPRQPRPTCTRSGSRCRTRTLPVDDFLIGELAGRLVGDRRALGERAASPSGTPRSASCSAFLLRLAAARARGARARSSSSPGPSSAPRRRPASSAVANQSTSSSVSDERRQALDDVHPVAGDLAEDPVVGEERHDDELGEDPRLHPLEHAPRRAPRRRARRTRSPTSARARARP